MLSPLHQSEHQVIVYRENRRPATPGRPRGRRHTEPFVVTAGSVRPRSGSIRNDAIVLSANKRYVSVIFPARVDETLIQGTGQERT